MQIASRIFQLFVGNLQYFEDTVISEECNPKLSIFENRIKSLTEFFGPSCKPGPWSPDPVLDFKLSTFIGYWIIVLDSNFSII